MGENVSKSISCQQDDISCQKCRYRMWRSASGELGVADIAIDFSENMEQAMRKTASGPKAKLDEELSPAAGTEETRTPPNRQDLEDTGELGRAVWESGTSSACSSGTNAHWRGNKRHVPQRLLITHTMGMLPSNALQLIIENGGDIHCHYHMDEVLGKGGFGVVRRARIKATGAERAVKEIYKDKMKTTRHLLHKEIQIMKVIDHPNMVMLHEIFEDDTNLYLVLELCEGGTLEDHLKRSRRFSERQCAIAMQQILRAIFYLHNHSICHRDMKAENVLCSSKSPIEKNTMKVSDFGLSCTLEPDEVLNKVAGTPTHMAPEVHAKRYSYPCDVWSCGVIVYQLFAGHYPFKAETKEELINKVVNKQVSFASEHWLEVSQDALDMVAGMLEKDPKKRLTAQKALNSSFIVEFAPKPETMVLPIRILRDLRKFRAQNKLKRAALHVIASMLTEEQLHRARQAFVSLDLNGDGSFTIQELQERLSLTSGKEAIEAAKVNQDEVFRDKYDPVGEGESSRFKDFTYTEFLAATFDRKAVIQDGVCQAAFNTFDKNGDGKVSISELATGKLLGKLTLEELADSLEEIDIDGDGEMDYAEFMKMMRNSGSMASLDSCMEKPAFSVSNDSQVSRGSRPSGGSKNEADPPSKKSSQRSIGRAR